MLSATYCQTYDTPFRYILSAIIEQEAQGKTSILFWTAIRNILHDFLSRGKSVGEKPLFSDIKET
jgi:hypothetical protein